MGILESLVTESQILIDIGRRRTLDLRTARRPACLPHAELYASRRYTGGTTMLNLELIATCKIPEIPHPVKKSNLTSYHNFIKPMSRIKGRKVCTCL